MSCFNFYPLSSFFYKTGEQKRGTGPAQRRVGTSWKEEVMGDRGRCKKCVHMHANAKMIPAETIPGIGEEGIKENNGGGEYI
jgi:hypothetical protein